MMGYKLAVCTISASFIMSHVYDVMYVIGESRDGISFNFVNV